MATAPINVDDTELLVEVTRGRPDDGVTLVESHHRGSLAVVDADGNLLASAGNPFMAAFLRSSAKPFQALPTVAAGAVDHFGISEAELAIMCASHHGTEQHIAVLQQLLDRIDLDPSALLCGVHWPIDEVASRQLAATGQEPDARHNNCSGKHAGMLTLARFWNCHLDDYTQFGHPVQRAILQQIGELTDLAPEDIAWAPDGCTVPNFAIPLARTALAFARLVSPDGTVAAQRVTSAMQAFPHLVSGHGALDDELMRAGQGVILCKGGAEGYEGLGVRTPHGRSVGIALKIADGNGRAKGPVLVAVLEALGLVDRATLDRLEPLRRPPLTNRRAQVVGEMRTVFELA